MEGDTENARWEYAWGQRLDINRLIYLETIEKVIKTPRNDNIVIERYEKRNNTGGDPDATQPGVDGVPDTEGSESHLLPDAELN